MSRTGEGFEEVLCVRAPKGTERRIKALRRKYRVPRAVLLRAMMDLAAEVFEVHGPDQWLVGVAERLELK